MTFLNVNLLQSIVYLLLVTHKREQESENFAVCSQMEGQGYLTEAKDYAHLLILLYRQRVSKKGQKNCLLCHLFVLAIFAMGHAFLYE